MSVRATLLMCLIVLLSAPLAPNAQDRRVAFDVTSVKASTPPEPNRFGLPVGPSMQFVPGGGFGATQATLRDLIRRAYDLPDFRVIGGAAWMGLDRFDVAARSESGFSGGVDDLRAMLRALLADRFRLRAHLERRELPVFHLVLARGDGKFGPRLRRSSVIGQPARPSFTMSGGAMTIAFEGQTLDDVARLLTSPDTQRHVINRIGMTGTFDGELTFEPEPLPGFPPPRVPSGATSLFTALQEQLGLKLEPSRGEVEVLVIDDAQRPAEN